MRLWFSLALHTKLRALIVVDAKIFWLLDLENGSRDQQIQVAQFDVW